METGLPLAAKYYLGSDDFHTILRNLPPRSLDQGVDQVENIVETHIASGLGSGNITYYNNAFILSTAPILTDWHGHFHGGFPAAERPAEPRPARPVP